MAKGPTQAGDLLVNLKGCSDPEDCMRDVVRVLAEHKEAILRQEFFLKENESTVNKLSSQIQQSLDYAKASHEETKVRFQQMDDEFGEVKQILNRDFLSDITETKIMVRRHDAIIPTLATREFVESKMRGHEGDEVARYGRRKDDKYKTVAMVTSIIAAVVAAGSLLAMAIYYLRVL